MKTKKCLGFLLIALVSIAGCTGDNGHLKTLSENDSKAMQQHLFDNWSDYDIRFRSPIIVFDPKNDTGKILLGGKQGWWWDNINDQEKWAEFLNANTTSQGNFNPLLADYPMTGVREIWGPDNQLYGFVIHQKRDIVNTQLVDTNTLRLWYSQARVGGGR